MFGVRATLILNRFILIVGIKFTAGSWFEIDALANKGKDYLESLNEKANVPHYGSCWKNAVADLEIGCRYLSENVQSDLALRFTNCFMEMSGLGPVVCSEPKCLKSLTDRAFNAFVEFYTHTQSMCYFLQSQIWHEEAEKTIEKLSVTSMHVSNQLEQAGKIQEELVALQKTSLHLQHDLVDNGKNLAIALEVSRDRMNIMMQEFQSSTQEHKQALFDLFDKFSSLKSWAINETSWLNSIAFYVSAVILAYFLTSTTRTQQARLYLFLLLTCNYVVEQGLYSLVVREAEEANLGLTDDANSLIWLCRRVLVFLCVIVTAVSALKYCDYNLINYHLLLEIKNQNSKLLKQFPSLTSENGLHRDYIKSVPLNADVFPKNNLSDGETSAKLINEKVDDLSCLLYQPFNSPVSHGRNSFKSKRKPSTPNGYDSIDNANKISKSSEKGNAVKESSHYNLRSSKTIRNDASFSQA